MLVFIDAKRFDRRVKVVNQNIVLEVIDKFVSLLKNNKNGNPYC